MRPLSTQDTTTVVGARVLTGTARRLGEVADERGVRTSDLIREAVDVYLAKAADERGVRPSDLIREHVDAYLTETARSA